jgi:hypothetical protein
MRVLHDFYYQKEACVYAMRHARPSSISLYLSSRVPIGLRNAPTLTGSVSCRLGFCAFSFWRRALRIMLSNSTNSSNGKPREGLFDLGVLSGSQGRE